MKITIDLDLATDTTEETWVSHCLEIDTIAQGSTPQEAIEALAEAVDMMVQDEMEASERDWEQAFLVIAKDVARRDSAPAAGTVAALAADLVAAGGTLPYPGTVACASSATPNPQSNDRDLILEVIHDMDRRVLQAEADGNPQGRELERQQSAALRRLLERADDFLGWHVRDARIGRPG
jgi:predicted RNase H-like HicB family nuclease